MHTTLMLFMCVCALRGEVVTDTDAPHGDNYFTFHQTRTCVNQPTGSSLRKICYFVGDEEEEGEVLLSR